MVVEAMAHNDLKRALDLLEPMSEDDQDQLRAKMAVAICRQNLDQAWRLIGQMGPTMALDAENAKLRIAWRLAPDSPGRCDSAWPK